MDPAQIYETTIIDRDSGGGLSFVTPPLHAIPVEDPLGHVLSVLRFEPARPDPSQPESDLHEVIDAMLAYPTEYRAMRLPRPPSEFAWWLANNARIPVEQSPVQGRTLTELLAGGGIAVGIADGEPLAVAVGLGAIILIGPADALGEWLTDKTRELLKTPPRPCCPRRSVVLSMEQRHLRIVPSRLLEVRESRYASK